MFKNAERLNNHNLNVTHVGAIMDFTPNNAKSLHEKMIKLSGHIEVIQTNELNYSHRSFLVKL